MSRERIAQQNRDQIAQVAARLIAQDHVLDLALAKRKAARQLGLADDRNMPTNQEVERELSLYREIYQQDHPSILLALRYKAVELMQMFDEFKPYLCGSVLTGSAGEQSDINLTIFTDNPKAVELFCLNHAIDYRILADRHQHTESPTIGFYYDDTPVRIAVRPLREQRQSSRGHGAPLERAQLAKVQALVAESEQDIATSDAT
ncbi:nucleotidyltransferase family protein [Parachitinimonas caeni]|uniref:Nucleotidyltransferase-like protein n=1 Tax=Parachitinimonas caeni TaxID=3031301 RepID=A0ABT7DSC5_9NEIS|nr:hypothetical protein [Parachitinimonas caeni]MDK2122968.1 hypothetical protein [Parachitinimonas caeni]